jgi:hypothetical protein
MSGTAFHMRPDGERAVYDGPHGPIAFPFNELERGTTRIVTPSGDATVAWDMPRSDYDALEAGVPAVVGGRELRIRSESDRALVLEGPDGLVAALRAKRFGRTEVEDARGRTMVSLKASKLSGEVDDEASEEHVAFALLALFSGLHDRGPGVSRIPIGF